VKMSVHLRKVTLNGARELYNRLMQLDLKCYNPQMIGCMTSSCPVCVGTNCYQLTQLHEYAPYHRHCGDCNTEWFVNYADQIQHIDVTRHLETETWDDICDDIYTLVDGAAHRKWV
jgi:hypothetical protein